MMENWNSGIMGSGIMKCWVNGSATDGIGAKIKMADILLETNIPAFHNSIILFSGRNQNPKNLYIISGLKKFRDV